MALITWLGVAPEELIDGSSVGGELLPPARGGFVRVDMAQVVEATGACRANATSRTTIQRLATVAQASYRTVASLTRWSAI